MKIGFDNINEYRIPMDQFPLKWRFTEEKYELIPDIHLAQLKPLNPKAAAFLWNYSMQIGLHEDIPFTKGFFSTIDKMKITNSNQKEVKKWLYQRGIPFSKEVYLSYQPDTAIVVPWKLLIKYFDSFYYADDLMIFDPSLNWAMLFYHEDEIYFGTNSSFTSSDLSEGFDFIW